jgi:PAS domain S-box-containing protein
MKQDSTFQKSINFLVTRFTSVIILIIIGFVALIVWQFHSFSNADVSVRHTHDVIHAIEEARAQLVDMETGMRGYALTGTKEFLEPYYLSEKKLYSTIGNLKNLVTDNHSQELRSIAFNKSVQTWKDYAADRINLRKNDKNIIESKKALEEQAHGKIIMDDLRKQLNELQNEEINLLQIRRDKLRNNYQFFLTILVSTGLFLICIVIILFRSHLKAVSFLHHNLLNSSVEAFEQMELSEGKFRAITELAPQFVWMSNGKGNITYSNSNLKEFMGVEQPELLGEKWLSQLHPDDREQTLSNWKSCIDTGKKYEIEFRVKNKDGDYSYFLNKAAPILDPATGKVNRWIGISVDITGRKTIEDELKRTSDLLKLIMSSTDDVIYIKDRASNMLYCNPMLLRLLNTTEENLYGKNDIEFLGPGNGGEETMKNDAKIMSTGKAESVEEAVIWHDGIKRIYLSQKYPWFDRSGNVIGLIGLSRDISNIKLTQVQLEEAIKTRDDFLSVASHELKTPLSSLKLQAQFIQKLFANEKFEELTLPRLKKFVDLTDKQVERLDRLVEDILDISRIRSGKLNMNPVRVTLNEIILGVVERLKPSMDNSGTPVQLNLEANVLGIWDKMRLEQVITNLLTNAMRYGDHKPVSLKLSLEDGTALLKIKDEGIGMDKETLNKIFQQFERGVSIDISGLGLGLFITRQIIELHGGKIWAESEGKNRGSTFYVRLPRFSTNILK